MIERSPGIPFAERASPETILRWAIGEYRPNIALACSFGGPSGMVVLDLAMGIDRSIPVYYIDTGLLFAQTHELAERVAAKYGIAPIAVKPRLALAEQASAYGEALWERDPDACCALRKVEPQFEFLRGFDAWISGIRRDQTIERRGTPVVQWDDRFGLVKINPLAAWTEREVWDYVVQHNLDYNALHDRGFPSIGCTPCTRAAAHAGDARAGRWAGSAKTECGLHAGPRIVSIGAA